MGTTEGAAEAAYKLAVQAWLEELKRDYGNLSKLGNACGFRQVSTLSRAYKMESVASKETIERLAAGTGRLVPAAVKDYLEVRMVATGMPQGVPSKVPESDPYRLGARDVPIRAVRRSQEGLYLQETPIPAFAARPPQLADRLAAYAVYVMDNKMVPAYRQGQTVYIDPSRPARDGEDDVFIEMQDGQVFIRHLVQQTDKTVTVEQFNPRKTSDLRQADIKALDRIVFVDKSGA